MRAYSIKLSRFVLFFLLPLLLSGCKNPPPETQLHYFSFGTTITIKLENVDMGQTLQLDAGIHQRLNRMNADWHAWRQSELTAIAQACQQNQSLLLSDDMVTLIQLGQKFEQQSQGYFNPALGELIDLWGFFSSTPQRQRTPPSQAEIDAVLARQAHMTDLELSENTLYCHNPSLRLDFGGFAKGYGIGQLADYLRQQGVKHALINIGGDIQTLGGKLDGSSWQVAVQDPNTEEPLATIASNAESIFTSAIGIRQFHYQGQSYHHLLNPKTGYPARGLQSVTVVHSNPSIADAAASALLLAGPESWHSMAKAMGIDKVLLVRDDGEIIVSAALQDQITLLKERA